MALIYHPGNGPLSEPLRQVAVGLLIVAAGVLMAWLGESRLPDVFRYGRQADIVGALSIGAGAILTAVGGAGWRLRRTWREMGFDLIGPEADAGPGILRGGRIGVVVRLGVRRPVILTRAVCTVAVFRRRTAVSRPGTRLHRMRVEAQGVRGLTLSPGDPLVLSFEQTLAAHMPPSSDTCLWQAEVEVRTHGAPDYLQKKTFTVR